MRDPLLPIKPPGSIEIFAEFVSVEIIWSDGCRHDPISRLSRIAIKPYLFQSDRDYIARKRTLHIEWPGLWISTRGQGNAFGVHAARIHCPGFHRVARENVEHRLDGVREYAMEFCGFEMVCLWRRRRLS